MKRLFLRARTEKNAFYKGFQPLKSLILTLSFIILTTLPAWAETLTASWYSTQSLKTEGTYKYSKGVMANGKQFDEQKFTAASRDYPLGTMLKVTNVYTGQSTIVEVTDRCNKRFKGERIDLSKRAFASIADCKQGIIKVRVQKL